MPTTTEVILHIGRQKTGTSSLQRALADSSGRLRKAGILYPDAGRRGIAHHRLAGAFLDKVRRDAPEAAAAIVAAAKAEIGAWPGKVVLSSEAFQNVKSPADLHQLLDPARCEVVVYLREHYAYAQSAYAQGVHARRWHGPFEGYLNRLSTSYCTLLMRWRGGLVPRRLHVRPFDREALENGDIVDDFAAVAGLPRNAIDATGDDRNPSIGGALLEFKRAMNGLPDLPDAFDRGYNLLSRIAARDPAFRIKPTVSSDLVDAFRSRFAPDLQAVVETYPQLAVLARVPPTQPVLDFSAADFHAVWQALDADSPEWARMARDALAASRTDDPVLLRIAEASG